MKKIELLAPAGDLEKLRFAYIYGADACFIGGKEVSLRARASNFELEDIVKAKHIADEYGKKLYITTNIIPHNDDIENILVYLKELNKIGVDAIIAASPIIIDLALKNTSLNVHISTQQSILNYEAVNYWAKKGCKRVVLGRELSLTEIELCKKYSKAEIEVFIHGGMCVSYSGRCVLSNNLTDRDANRGGCAHSCRWNYDLFHNEELINKDMPFSMSSKDLQTVKYIPSLIKANVDSLKIEGRMKSIHYIATVVSTYRKLIDAYYKNKDLDMIKYESEIKKAENRLTSFGFMDGDTTTQQQLYNMRSEKPTKEFVGIVVEYDIESKIVLVEQRNYFTTLNIFEVFRPNKENYTFSIDSIYDVDGNLLDAARHPKQLIKFKIDEQLNKYDIIRIVK